MDEDASLLRLLELEQYGEKAMEIERLETKSAELEQQSQAGTNV